MKSGWWSWGCLAWSKGGSGRISSLSTSAWKEGCSQVSVSSHRQLTTGQEDIASSPIRGGSGWTPGRMSSWKELLNIEMDSPERWWSHNPWRCWHGTQCYGLIDKMVFGQRLDLNYSLIWCNMNLTHCFWHLDFIISFYI